MWWGTQSVNEAMICIKNKSCVSNQGECSLSHRQFITSTIYERERERERGAQFVIDISFRTTLNNNNANQSNGNLGAPRAHKEDQKELMSSKGGWRHLGGTWKQEKRKKKENKRTTK